MAGRPYRQCPVCGTRLLLSCLFAHIGSSRCLSDLQYKRDGKVFDEAHGPDALKAAQTLSRVIRELPET